MPIEIEGKEPKPAELKELIQHARENKIKVAFVQPQFSTKSAELVARELGDQVAFADPLAEDWMANFRALDLNWKNFPGGPDIYGIYKICSKNKRKFKMQQFL